MRHHNSVFHTLLKHVPWSVFDRLVDKHKADRRVRRLTTKNQFLALLFGQLSGSASLREIEAGLISQSARLYHVGGRPVARTTLADANAKRPADMFGELFAHMAAGACRRTRRHMADAVRILDATRLHLSSLSDGWIDTVKGARAIKLHIAYDPHAEVPLEAAFTGQRVNDITPAKAMPITPGMTYVFDLAYYDFAWWAELDARGCRFVSRLKSNTHLKITAEQPVPEESTILSDRIGLMTQRLSHARRNPFTEPLREIRVRIATGKVIRLVTNDLDASATEIAALYKQRWQIELFFKWLKQNLKIAHFLGSGRNAVTIQIMAALIAYLLLRIASLRNNATLSLQALARLMPATLLTRRSIHHLLQPPPDPTPPNPAQLEIAYA